MDGVLRAFPCRYGGASHVFHYNISYVCSHVGPALAFPLTAVLSSVTQVATAPSAPVLAPPSGSVSSTLVVQPWLIAVMVVAALVVVAVIGLVVWRTNRNKHAYQNM